jgi:hypothetical protein
MLFLTDMLDDIKNLNKIFLFGFLCLVNILLAKITSTFLLSTDLYFNQFNEQMTYDQIRSFIDIQYKYQWISYLILPFIYLIKLSLLSLILLTGIIFWNIKISFKKLSQPALGELYLAAV